LARCVGPALEAVDSNRGLLYTYFGVGIFSAMLMDYKVHMYSSGRIEEDWKVKI